MVVAPLRVTLLTVINGVLSDKIGRYSYTYEETMDPVVYDTEYDQVEDEEEDWAFGLWR